MEKDEIKEKIKTIAIQYIKTQEIADDTPLTSRPYSAGALSVAAIFICIEKEFGVDLNKVFDHAIDYSVRSIADAVSVCIHDHNVL